MPILGTRPRPKVVRHAAVVAALALSATLAGCSGTVKEVSRAGDTPAATPTPSKAPEPQATVIDNVPAKQDVPVSHDIEVHVEDGTFDKIMIPAGSGSK